MAYNKIGVFGATGGLGQEVTRALAEAGFEVVPFSRNSTAESLQTVAEIPTQPLGSLVGFDAIVSTVGHLGMKDQIPLIEQAKRDGVKRFVPSEFGIDSRTVKADFFNEKVEIFEAVEKAEFPDGWTAVAAGFYDNMVPIFMNVDLKQSKITVRGQGKQQHPFVMRHDIGRVLAYTFKHPQDYKNSWLIVASGWFSLNELAEDVCTRYGRTFDVEHAELDQTTPVLRLFELNNIEPFGRESKDADLPVELDDMRDYVRRIEWD